MRLETYNTRSVDGEHRWKTVDEYQSSYWSGLDAQIFAGNVFLDELVGLQWRLEEAVAPVFGYASYVYDTVMHGARRVQGSFTFNFKRQGYLYELLEQWANPNRDLLAQSAAAAQPDWTRSEAFRLAREGHATVEDLVAMAAQAGTPTRNKDGLAQLDPKNLSRVADAFERAIWEEPAREQSARVKQTAGALVARTDLHKPRFRITHPVDLSVHFGSVAQQGGSARVQGAGLAGLTGEGEASLPIGTSLKLLGVVLTSREQGLDDSGRPVLETYTFVAKDVI